MLPLRPADASTFPPKPKEKSNRDLRHQIESLRAANKFHKEKAATRREQLLQLIKAMQILYDLDK